MQKKTSLKHFEITVGTNLNFYEIVMSLKRNSNRFTLMKSKISQVVVIVD